LRRRQGVNRTETLDTIMATGVVAVIRMKDTARLVRVVEAIRTGGVRCIEITMTVPGAVEIIAAMTKELPPDVCVGAGTVTNRKTAEAVIGAGARFVVGPILNTDVIVACRTAGVICIPGCYTPTEILTGWEAGADIVKVFPATSLGPKFFKDVAGPFPHIRLMPTGGVTIDNVGEWVKAGAVAVGIGSDLLDKKAIDEGRYEVLTERAARMVKNFQDAKGSLVRPS
jgi:2-dehydro-3-deoxyphosphogluconate aldolase / (4S)-4-hydroxy-2-oxoglutarate aldolase